MSRPDAEVVIAGGGLAAQRCCARLRREGFDGRVIVVCEEQRAPYDRPPLSKDVLAGERSAESLDLRPPRWYEENRIELLIGNESTEPRSPHEGDRARARGRSVAAPTAGGPAALRASARRHGQPAPPAARPRAGRRGARAEHARGRAGVARGAARARGQTAGRRRRARGHGGRLLGATSRSRGDDARGRTHPTRPRPAADARPLARGPPPATWRRRAPGHERRALRARPGRGSGAAQRRPRARRCERPRRRRLGAGDLVAREPDRARPAHTDRPARTHGPAGRLRGRRRRMLSRPVPRPRADPALGGGLPPGRARGPCDHRDATAGRDAGDVLERPARKPHPARRPRGRGRADRGRGSDG